MSKSIVLILLGVGAMILALTLTGCSDEASPTVEPTATATLRPTATVMPTAEPTRTVAPTAAPTATVTPTATPIAAPTQTPMPTPAPTSEPTEEVVIEHGNARAIATEIAVGEPIAGAVDYEEDIDFFRFTSQAGQLYLIDVALGTLDDSEVELLDADGWSLAINDDYGDSMASRIFWYAEISGDYYVSVRASWGSDTSTGSYTLTVALSDIDDDHSNSIDGATAIQVGQSTEGNLDYARDIDLFLFTAEAGQIYQVDVVLGTLEESVVSLLDADGRSSAITGVYGDSQASRITWYAESSGGYHVSVGAPWGSDTGTGSYTLTVALTDIADDHANSIDGATAIQVGQSAESNLDYDDDVDIFRFDAQAGQIYQIDVALGTLADSVVELLDANDWTLASNNGFAGSMASGLIWRALGSGEHYIAVRGYGTGSYTLAVALSDIDDDHANSIDGATAIQVGQSAEGNLDYDDDVDIFRFDAQAGQLYQIDVALGTLDDSAVVVLDADGRGLDYNDDFEGSLASSLVWSAPVSGEYYISVRGYGTGSYTLTVALSDIDDDHANSIANATPTPVGQSVEGYLDYAGDIDLFRFSAEAGQLYQIDVALGTLDDSEAELLDADGWGLASNDDFGDSRASRITWYAESSGDYHVSVGSSWSSETGTGSYTLTIDYSNIEDDHANSIDGATAAVIGGNVQGNLDYDGDEDIFVFEAQQDMIYQIDVALGTLDDSVVEVLNADGRRLEYNDDFGSSLASSLVWRAPGSGEHYIMVWGYGTGSYTLTAVVR